jgi:hypothetical protein
MVDDLLKVLKEYDSIIDDDEVYKFF